MVYRNKSKYYKGIMLIQLDIVILIEMKEMVILLLHPLHPQLLLLHLTDWSQLANYTFNLHSVAIFLIVHVCLVAFKFIRHKFFHQLLSLSFGHVLLLFDIVHVVSLCLLVFQLILTLQFQRNSQLILDNIFPQSDTVVNRHTNSKGLIELRAFTSCQCFNILFAIKFYVCVPNTLRNARQGRVLLEGCRGYCFIFRESIVKGLTSQS